MISHSDRACLLCGTDEAEEVCSYSVPDQYERAVGVETNGYERKWVQCTRCKFYYSRYSRSPQALDSIYLSDYRAGSSSWRSKTTEEIFNYVIALPPEQSETKQRIDWIKSQIEVFWKSGIIKKEEHAPYHMLDIGGATGVFAYEFRDENWLSYVVDPSIDGIFMQEKYGIPYQQKYYEPGGFGVRFDLIALVFVLEHHRDPILLLKQAKEDMKQDSLLYIEVPDALCFRYKSPDDDIFNACHLWMFSPRTLLDLLDQCGFEALSMRRTKTIRGHYSLMALSGIK